MYCCFVCMVCIGLLGWFFMVLKWWNFEICIDCLWVFLCLEIVGYGENCICKVIRRFFLVLFCVRFLCIFLYILNLNLLCVFLCLGFICNVCSEIVCCWGFWKEKIWEFCKVGLVSIFRKEENEGFYIWDYYCCICSYCYCFFWCGYVDYILGEIWWCWYGGICDIFGFFDWINLGYLLEIFGFLFY